MIDVNKGIQREIDNYNRLNDLRKKGVMSNDEWTSTCMIILENLIFLNQNMNSNKGENE